MFLVLEFLRKQNKMKEETNNIVRFIWRKILPTNGKSQVRTSNIKKCHEILKKDTKN